MDLSKTKVISLLLFLFLALFPFGQLFRYEFFVGESRIVILAIDIIAGIFLVITLLDYLKSPLMFRFINIFILVAIFSYVLSGATFNAIYLPGFLYLLRLLAYVAFFVAVKVSSKKKKYIKKFLFKSLLVVLVVAAAFSWVQYLFFPDLRQLLYLGWDDHLFRLTGTFLDPGFTGIILVFGALLALSYNSLFLSLFFILSVAFTYSRAGYLALLAGLIAFLFLKRKKLLISLLIVIFAVVIIFLPRPEGHGVRLERTYSITARIQNYQETLNLSSYAPLFGVGFNNICLVKTMFLKTANVKSHSCSGSDSSLLLVLTTTGVLGLSTFLFSLRNRVQKIQRSSVFGAATIACLSALLIHSLFVNSLFYPWVMGFMAILWGISEA